MSRLLAADIFEALGKPQAAEWLRAGEDLEERRPLVLDEIDTLDARIEELEGQLAELEALLCKRCKDKWNKASGSGSAA